VGHRYQVPSHLSAACGRNAFGKEVQGCGKHNENAKKGRYDERADSYERASENDLEHVGPPLWFAARQLSLEVGGDPRIVLPKLSPPQSYARLAAARYPFEYFGNPQCTHRRAETPMRYHDVILNCLPHRGHRQYETTAPAVPISRNHANAMIMKRTGRLKIRTIARASRMTGKKPASASSAKFRQNLYRFQFC
jgi:hypothetical protein